MKVELQSRLGTMTPSVITSADTLLVVLLASITGCDSLTVCLVWGEEKEKKQKTLVNPAVVLLSRGDTSRHL